MNIHEAAAELSGGQYRKEGSKELFSRMKASGLLAIYGYSDDGVILNGWEHDQQGTGTLHFTPDGLLVNKCEDERCPYFAKLEKLAATVTPVWCEDVGDTSGYSWKFRTDIPHAVFTIKDDDDLFCEGIVFAIKDALKRTPD